MCSLFFEREDDRKTLSAPLCFALAVLQLVGMGFPAFAEERNPSLPSKEEAKALVERSNKLTSLRAFGSAPFHIHAKVKSYGPKGQNIQGTYELWWASLDRWREEINWGDKSFARIANNNRLWIIGADTYRLDTLHVTELLGFSSRIGIPADRSIDRVQAKQIGGVPAICMRLFHFSSAPGEASIAGTGLLIMSPLNVERSACWDAATGLPLRIEAGSDRVELGNYSAIGDKQFPHKLHELRGGKTLIEVELDSLELLDVMTTDALTPPGGTSAKPWCVNMISPTPLRFGNASSTTSLPGGGFNTPLPTELLGRELVVFRVDEAGRAVDVHAFTTGGEVSFKDRERLTLLESRFRPATCDGRPVEADFVMHGKGR